VTARKVGLLLVILAVGAALETAWSVRETGFGPVGCRAVGWYSGPSFAYESESRHPVPPAVSLQVQNRHGDVSISGGEAGDVQVKLRKVVYVPDEDRARAFASRIQLTAALEGGTLRLGTNRNEIQHGREGRDLGFETHLEVRVPPGTRVQVQNEHGATSASEVAEVRLWTAHGDVRVENVERDAEVDSRHGDLTVSQIGGALNLKAGRGRLEITAVTGPSTVVWEHGELAASRTGPLDVTLQHADLVAITVAGELRVRGSHAGVQATDVRGPVTVTTSFRDVVLDRIDGEARVEQEHAGVEANDVRGPLGVVVQHGDVQVRRIGGRLEVRTQHGGLQAEDIEGGARVDVSGDGVVLDRFTGAVEVEASRGGVSLVPAGPLTEAVSARSRYGGVRLEVPEGSRFDLTADASRGEVEVDLPGLMVIESRPRRLSGRLGDGGATVSLSAEHGDVHVEARRGAARTDQR
jgi:DUF4097 and DUF4098 domain-containing protein YvlB